MAKHKSKKRNVRAVRRPIQEPESPLEIKKARIEKNRADFANRVDPQKRRSAVKPKKPAVTASAPKVQKPAKKVKKAEEPVVATAPPLAEALFKKLEEAILQTGQQAKETARKHFRYSLLYMWGSALVLLVTTVIWSWLGAMVNQDNADQLVNAYLFENGDTFSQAIFPSPHSFLLKWPLFWLVKLFHYTPAAFISLTIVTSVATVGLFAWLLYRIERRPVYFGTLCLALASALILVPTQPYAGGLLPVNMAMLTTRNLEYLLFIGALLLASRLNGFVTKRFIVTTAALTLLIASDKLFIPLTIGAAVLGGFVYIATKRFQLLSNAAYLLLAGITAAFLADVVIWAINASGITNLSSAAGVGGSAYDLGFDFRGIALGLIYLIGGFLSNMGANPGFDATVLRNLPRLAFERLISPAAIAYIVNIIVALSGLFAVGYTAIKQLLPANTKDEPEIDRGQYLALTLLWASIAASGAFVFSKHEYGVDARYVTIWFFTAFVALASFLKRQKWTNDRLYAAGILLAVAIICGSWGSFQNHNAERAALDGISQRNQTIVQALKNRHTNLLVGDYWRVIPAKAMSGNKLTVSPLADCTNARTTLTSDAWNPDLHRRSFAYLLSFDRGLTDYPACSLAQVISHYGRPSSSVTISGKIAKPTEILLFYDHGINDIKEGPISPAQAAAAVIPELFANLKHGNTVCSGGRQTIMNVVAHEDDDLLFINPDTDRAIAEKKCVRTIYLTAGDAGNDQFYWLGRERGSEDAYTAMAGPEIGAWNQRIINLGDDDPRSGEPSRYVSIASPVNNPDISLIFFHLPDGGLGGNGFNRSHHESLAKLESGRIGQIHTIDNQSVYSANSLTNSLTDLIRLYRPDEIRTQSDYGSLSYPDHADHIATGHFASRAKNLYLERSAVDVPIAYYRGYTGRDLVENVEGGELNRKQDIFFAYGSQDQSVCNSVESCANTDTYYNYLRRQHSADH